MTGLHYVAAHPHRRGVRGIVLATLVAGAIVASCRLTPALWRHAQYRYRQSRCLGFTYPPETVLFDDDPARCAALYASQPGAFRVMGSGSYQALYRLPPPCAAPAGIFEADDGFAFLHERTTASGSHVLVATYYQTSHDDRGGHDLAVEVSVFAPAGARPGSRLTYASGDSALVHTGGGPLRVLAGQPDPTDGSRFTIACEAGGRRRIIEGKVVDPLVIPKTDGSVAYCGNALGYQVHLRQLPQE